MAVLAAMASAGCDVDVRVGIDVDDDGSGRVQATVELDRHAVEQVGDLKGQLRVADLEKAGWEIAGPETVAGGGQRVVAVRRFLSPAGAATAMQQLSGEDGPFQDFRVETDSSFLRTTTRFRGRVDLQAGLDAFGDEALRDKLGTPVGVDAEEFERRAGAALAEIFGFEVAVRLPGTVESNAPVDAGNGAVWKPRLGEDVTLVASAEQWNRMPIALAAVALVSAVAAVVVARRARRGPSRAHARARRRGGATPDR